MHKTFTAALAVAAISAASPAAAITFAGSFAVTDYNTDSGLIVDVTPASGPFGFDLDFAGDTETEYLFNISTPESDVGADDFAPQPIEVTFSFTSPGNFGGTVGGDTFGTSTWVWIFNFQEGVVEWNNPAPIAFGNGGLLSVSLNDTEFGEGLYGLSQKTAKVKATFTLESVPTAVVPEPASWALMIGGFGMAGATLRRRRALVA